MYVILARLNELPPEIRFDVENTYAVAIWFKKKPDMNMFFSQYVLESRSLFAKGFKWTKSNGEVARTKAVCLNCGCDLIAKCTVQKTVQFNAYEGCCFCYHPGDLVDLTNDVVFQRNAPEPDESSESDAGSEPDVDNLNLVGAAQDATMPRQRKKIVKQVRYCFSTCGLHPTRTDEEFRNDMLQSEVSGEPVRGVLGVTALALLPEFDLINGFVIDSLHGLYLGTTKHLLNLWLDAKYSTKPFSVRKSIEEINRRLFNLKPPLKLYKLFESVARYPNLKGKMLELWTFFFSEFLVL